MTLHRLLPVALVLSLVAVTGTAGAAKPGAAAKGREPGRGRAALIGAREAGAGIAQGAGLQLIATGRPVGMAIAAGGTALGMVGNRPRWSSVRAAVRHPVQTLKNPLVQVRLLSIGVGTLVGQNLAAETGI